MPTATCSRKINKAFVLGPEDLRYFYREGKTFIESNTGGAFKTEVVGVVKDIDAILIREQPDSIIGYSNPRRNEIACIAMLMESEDEEHSFKLVFENTPFDAPAYLSVGGKTVSEVQPCFRKLEAELVERARWYSFISNRVWLIKCRWVLLVIGVLLVVLGLIGALARAYQLKCARANVTAILSEHSNGVSDANQAPVREKAEEALRAIDRASSPLHVVKWVLICFAAFFVVKFEERFIQYLFPRVVFEIGAGKKRHENIKRLRKWIGYWTMSLIVGLVLLIISRRL